MTLLEVAERLAEMFTEVNSTPLLLLVVLVLALAVLLLVALAALMAEIRAQQAEERRQIRARRGVTAAVVVEALRRARGNRG